MASVTVMHNESRNARFWLLLAGFLALLLGVIGLYLTFGLTIAGVIWYGALMLAAGLVQIIEPLMNQAETGRSRWTAVLLGLVYAAGGLWALFNPLSASLVLTLVLGVALVTSGILKAIWAFVDRSRQSNAGLVLAAVLSLILGGLLIAQWPLSGLWTIGLLISCDLIAHGAALVWKALKTH
ncbi:HdeD family acid-resistance protein [Microvirga sp. 2MCAF38]|uniref:HdeD family acid-resistance protein n=1 Tax=Microvirga sp. 2MCAF38 TaxID=3232989 RepID=UPI003F95209A